VRDASPYPDELSHTVTATDGTTVFVRPIRPEDADRLIAFHTRLSEHTAYQRFFTAMKRLPPDWARMLATVDYVTRLALVAEVATPGGLELVAVARYEPTSRADTVELAFVVQDGWQNKGLGTVLFQALLRAAQARGFQRFSAYVLATNRRMLDLIGRFATVVERTLDHGVVEATFTAGAAPAPKRSKRLATALLVCGLAVAVASAGCSAGVAARAPAAVTDRSRNVDQTNDFLRIIFLPPGVTPTTLGGQAALRVFAGASAFVRPPLSLAETVAFPGLVNSPGHDLVVLRCVPPSRSAEPTLATWPNVLALIVADLGGQQSCPAPPGAAENAVYCRARDFTDQPSPVASVSLARALAVGAAMFEDADHAEVLRRRYGIYPAFSGLGFSVKGSGDGAAMRSADVLRRSVIPEYLLRNVTLAEAGCRCISVPPYPGRDDAPLDPDLVAREGGDGHCVRVQSLGPR